MTLRTGKSGRSKYYKCTNRVNKGNAQCTSGNIPMGKLEPSFVRKWRARQESNL